MSTKKNIPRKLPPPLDILEEETYPAEEEKYPAGEEEKS
jgi:hypothetical protein